MRIKRVLLGFGAVVGVLVAVPAVALGLTFAGDSPIKDGEALGARGKQIKDGIVTAGVIDIGGGGIALVDCGNDKDAAPVVAELKKRNLDESAVKAIFITHGHPDHVNGCLKFPKADVYAMAAEKDLIEGRAKAKGPVTSLFPAKDSGVKVTHALADGDVTKVGDVDVTAYAVPGHTAGSAVYLIDGVVYFGDAASANKDGKVTTAKWLMSDDQKQATASLEALKSKLAPHAAEIKTLEFAHTGTLAGFGPLEVFNKK